MFCPKCGAKLGDDARFCTACGASVTAEAAAAVSIPAVEDEELYRALVGPRQDYYWSRFSRFIADKKMGMSWHWPSFFFTFYWLMYRKMWVPALLYFFLPYGVFFVFGIIIALTGGNGNVMGALYLLYIGAIFIVPPLYANALYFNHCKEKIVETTRGNRSREHVLGELSGKGGTSLVWVAFFMIVVIALFGILAAIAVPAYQSYVIRAKVAAAEQTGRQVAPLVAAYHAANNALPASIEEAGFKGPLPPAISGVRVDQQNGTLVIGLKDAGGKSIMLVPSVDSDNQVTWQCVSDSIPQAMLGKRCQAISGDGQ